MCIPYIPSEYSTYYKAREVDVLGMIANEVVKFAYNRSVMILGDINARTNTTVDYIENESVRD